METTEIELASQESKMNIESSQTPLLSHEQVDNGGQTNIAATLSAKGQTNRNKINQNSYQKPLQPMDEFRNATNDVPGWTQIRM